MYTGRAFRQDCDMRDSPFYESLYFSLLFLTLFFI